MFQRKGSKKHLECPTGVLDDFIRSKGQIPFKLICACHIIIFFLLSILIYNFALVSGVQQSESVIHISTLLDCFPT